MADYKQQILDFIKKKGPSTPNDITRGTGMNSLIISAMLSDASERKQLGKSCMRIGSSHLYFTIDQKDRARARLFNSMDDRQKCFLKDLEARKVILDSEIDEESIREYCDFLNGFTLGERKAWHWFELEGQNALKLVEVKMKAASAAAPEPAPVQVPAPVPQAEVQLKPAPEPAAPAKPAPIAATEAHRPEHAQKKQAAPQPDSVKKKHQKKPRQRPFHGRSQGRKKRATVS